MACPKSRKEGTGKNLGLLSRALVRLHSSSCSRPPPHLPFDSPGPFANSGARVVISMVRRPYETEEREEAARVLYAPRISRDSSLFQLSPQISRQNSRVSKTAVPWLCFSASGDRAAGNCSAERTCGQPARGFRPGNFRTPVAGYSQSAGSKPRRPSCPFDWRGHACAHQGRPLAGERRLG